MHKHARTHNTHTRPICITHTTQTYAQTRSDAQQTHTPNMHNAHNTDICTNTHAQCTHTTHAQTLTNKYARTHVHRTRTKYTRTHIQTQAHRHNTCMHGHEHARAHKHTNANTHTHARKQTHNQTHRHEYL